MLGLPELVRARKWLRCIMRMMSTASPVVVSVPPFESTATAIMDELQASLGSLVTDLPEPIRRAVDLERSLRLEKKLAWQVFRLSRSVGLREIANVPSRAGLERVIEASRRKHVPKQITDRISKALERFEDFAETQCGNRIGLISMVSGLTHQKSDQFELKVRKAYFQAASHVWGMQARMQIRTAIAHNPDPVYTDSQDEVLISTDLDMQRLRLSDPLVVVRWVLAEGPEDCRDHVIPEGRTKNGDPVNHPVELLPEFCSQPLPKIVAKRGEDGLVENELIVPPGRAGAVTLCSSQLTERSRIDYNGRMFITMPVEEIVWELLIPAGLSNPATARAAVYGRRPHPERVLEERPVDLLPQRETVTYLGAMESVPALDGVPGHPDSVRHVLQKLGWLGMRFDVYRCRVRYPVLHTLVVAQVDVLKQ